MHVYGGKLSACRWRQISETKISGLNAFVALMYIVWSEMCWLTTNMWKVKQSNYRPWGFQKDEAAIFQDNRHIEVVRLSALRTGRFYPPGNIPGTQFLSEAESTPWPQCGRKDYVNEKIPMTLSGIETATFRLVAQCVNQLRHGVQIY